jgi:hypothetical protein
VRRCTGPDLRMVVPHYYSWLTFLSYLVTHPDHIVRSRKRRPKRVPEKRPNHTTCHGMITREPRRGSWDSKPVQWTFTNASELIAAGVRRPARDSARCSCVSDRCVARAATPRGRSSFGSEWVPINSVDNQPSCYARTYTYARRARISCTCRRRQSSHSASSNAQP